jgi:hypothetical protein
MSNLNTREEKLKLVFAAHPEAEEIYMTSDDRAFFKESYAEAHAKGLPDQAVERFEREQDASTGSETEQTEDAPETEDGGQKTEELTGAETGAGDASTGSATDAEDDRAVWVAKFEEVFGKKPNNFMKLDTIKARIAEAEAN